MLQKTIALSVVVVAMLAPDEGRADEDPLAKRPTSRISTSMTEDSAAIGIKLDFARILTFDHPARTIVIGNPLIVDGVLSDPNTIVLTGKATGTTNLIVLGEAGNEIANYVISVSPNNLNLTTVHHGATQQVFTCAGPCAPLATTIIAPVPAK